MKTPIAILLGCMLTGFGAYADSGNKSKVHLTASQKEPNSFCIEIKESIISMGKEFKEVDNTFFFNQYFEHNTNFHKSGIYLFKNYRGIEERKAKQKKA